MNDSEEVAPGIREGDMVAGKYRVEKLLGLGGMGVVIAAHHVHLDEPVAIKMLLPGALANQEAVSRFAREARAAVKIKSEHVARVSDVGVLENGAPFMVMEYLDGADLFRFLEGHGPLSVEQAAEFILQASEAVAEAHSLGIVHRDLKPANLFVIRRPDGTLSVKVLDFGISKVTGASGSAPDVFVTKTSALMGSPLYMSPEQMRSSKDIDVRTDIWSLGIILYELVAAAPAFAGETMPELVLKVATDAPRPLSSHRADLPPGFEDVILRCLEKDRERRFQTVAELAVALAPFAPKRARESVERISGILRAAGSSVPAFVVPPPSSGQERSETMSQFGRTASGARRGKRALVSVATFAGVVAAILVGRALLAPRENEQPAAGSSAPVVAVPRAGPPVGAEPTAAGSVAPRGPTVEPSTSVGSPPRGAPSANGIAGRAGTASHSRTGAGHTAPAGSPGRPRPQSPKPNCEQNFYLDANGEKHFKRECFAN